MRQAGLTARRLAALGPIWALELHRLGGRWYVYFTAAVRGHVDDEHQVFAPGHDAVFKSPDRPEDRLIYHANAVPNYRCDRRGSPRAQPFRWTADGAPDLGVPVRQGAALPAPSGETAS